MNYNIHVDDQLGYLKNMEINVSDVGDGTYRTMMKIEVHLNFTLLKGTVIVCFDEGIVNQ